MVSPVSFAQQTDQLWSENANTECQTKRSRRVTMKRWAGKLRGKLYLARLREQKGVDNKKISAKSRSALEERQSVSSGTGGRVTWLIGAANGWRLNWGWWHCACPSPGTGKPTGRGAPCHCHTHMSPGLTFSSLSVFTLSSWMLD